MSQALRLSAPAHPASFLRVTELGRCGIPRCSYTTQGLVAAVCAFQYLAGNDPTNAMFITPRRETRPIERNFHLG
jgi:hypothetical protein